MKSDKNLNVSLPNIFDTEVKHGTGNCNPMGVPQKMRQMLTTFPDYKESFSEVVEMIDSKIPQEQQYESLDTLTRGVVGFSMAFVAGYVKGNGEFEITSSVTKGGDIETKINPLSPCIDVTAKEITLEN